MLHRVREYGLKGGESEPGFKPQQIRWAIVFDAQGGYLGIKELGDAGQARNAGLRIAKCPTIEQTGDVIWSQFLWSDLRKMLAWSKDESGQKKAEACQQFFLDRLAEASECLGPLAASARSLAVVETRETAIAELKARKAKPSRYSCMSAHRRARPSASIRRWAFCTRTVPAAPDWRWI